jgi:CubicO group peptidase (beta-lactamase class C family)
MVESSETMKIRREMEAAVAGGVFPGGVLLAAVGETVAVIAEAGRMESDPPQRPVEPDTIYDLASLTKILSTTLLAMILVDQDLLDLDAPLGDFFSDELPAPKERIRLRDLLSHSSGMPAWRPLYETLANLPMRERRSAAIRFVLKEPLESNPGRRAVYSDLNYILLGLILEKITGERQDVLFGRLIHRPLRQPEVGYRALDRNLEFPTRIAPTEDLGEGNVLRRGLIWGVVHDDNAAVLGGVAGHAGLFGTAMGVWKVFRAIRRSVRDEPCGSLVSRETAFLFLQKAHTAPESTWAMGFDMPSRTGSSAGRYFSRNSVGHLGFTGTSLWHDMDRDLTVVLLTNRVHPSADNTAIRAFRPRIHDLVVETLF